jgi:hypothetical protein
MRVRVCHGDLAGAPGVSVGRRHRDGLVRRQVDLEVRVIECGVQIVLDVIRLGHTYDGQPAFEDISFAVRA